jgi:hypothetical protein
MPDTLASFESNSIPPSRAGGSVNGHRANPKATKAKRSRDECPSLEVWRRLKLAQERVDRGVPDNDPLITAYHEAQDWFVDCKVTSLRGVLLKLLLLDETEDLDRIQEEAPRMLWPQIVKSLLRDLKTQVDSDDRARPAGQCANGERTRHENSALAAVATLEPTPQSPRTFIAGIVTALRPFMDGWTRQEGVADVQVYEALRPFFGTYTVGDAALMLAQLEAASLAMPGETNAAGDSPSFGALCEAKSMLEDFAVEANASGPDCVGARAFLLKNAGTDDGLVCEGNLEAIYASIRNDTLDLRSGTLALSTAKPSTAHTEATAATGL